MQLIPRAGIFLLLDEADVAVACGALLLMLAFTVPAGILLLLLFPHTLSLSIYVSSVCLLSDEMRFPPNPNPRPNTKLKENVRETETKIHVESYTERICTYGNQGGRERSIKDHLQKQDCHRHRRR